MWVSPLWKTSVVVIMVVGVVFVRWFNRVPHRVSHSDNKDILSPADGTVLKIVEHADTYQVIIYLNVFNVHCQWIPIDGRITKIEHKAGKFHPAYMWQKSQYNEACTTHIKTPWGMIQVKQIAGQLARRIYAYTQVDQQVRKNQLLGRIALSSRVDVTIPKHARLHVHEGDTVVGNETLLARFGTVVYMDGVFDLFHVGHVRAIQQMREHGDTVVVGVLGDQDATAYKRKPVIDENARAEIVRACQYVDRVICPCPLVITKAFLQKNKIDCVVHAYANEDDRNKQKHLARGVPIKEMQYCADTSTTRILQSFISYS